MEIDTEKDAAYATSLLLFVNNFVESEGTCSIPDGMEDIAEYIIDNAFMVSASVNRDGIFKVYTD